MDDQTITQLGNVAAWLRERGLNNWALAVDKAIVFTHVNLPNMIKEAEARGYQMARDEDEEFNVNNGFGD